MLAPFQSSPLPTFENFVAESREGFTLSNIKQVETVLDEVRLEMKASRIDAEFKHPDSPQEAVQSLFDWACKVTTRKLGRELDEVEQAYLQERCKPGVD